MKNSLDKFAENVVTPAVAFSELAIEKYTPKDFPVNKSAVKGVDVLGKALGWYDAGNAIAEAINNPTAGNITKAAFKTTLAGLETFMKTNPVVGVITTIADVTGFTDWIFNW
jgi:hypothetical protein